MDAQRHFAITLVLTLLWENMRKVCSNLIGNMGSDNAVLLNVHPLLLLDPNG